MTHAASNSDARKRLEEDLARPSEPSIVDLDGNAQPLRDWVLGPDASKRVLAWTVSLDDHYHPIGAGRVVHVAQQQGSDRAIQVWTEETPESLQQQVHGRARVFGTGHPIPLDLEHAGSLVAANGLVWHIYTTSAGVHDA